MVIYGFGIAKHLKKKIDKFTMVIPELMPATQIPTYILCTVLHSNRKYHPFLS